MTAYDITDISHLHHGGTASYTTIGLGQETLVLFGADWAHLQHDILI